jgi:Na+/H+ antiporter NhaC
VFRQKLKSISEYRPIPTIVIIIPAIIIKEITITHIQTIETMTYLTFTDVMVTNMNMIACSITAINTLKRTLIHPPESPLAIKMHIGKDFWMGNAIKVKKEPTRLENN